MSSPTCPHLGRQLAHHLLGFGFAIGLATAATPPPPVGAAAPGNRRIPLHSESNLNPARPVGFTAVPAPASGIRFTNRLDEERSLTNQIFLNGSGVAAGDVDGDGRVDLYFCGLDAPNALYRNLGQWRFEEITDASGNACADQASTGAALVDIDGDGDLDLLVNGIARGTRLFLNDGHGRFTETTEASGLAATTGATSFAIADVDGDGALDVYVVNYRSETMRDQPGINFTLGVTNGVRRLLAVNGQPATTPELAGRFSFDAAGGVLENGEPDVLFRNLGGGRFERVAWTNGFADELGRPMDPPYDWGLSAMFHDVNDDGAPDLYVCNDFQSPDRFWINDGHGHFRAVPRRALRQTSLFSMGVDFADVDRDGADDFFVADMLSREHVRRQVQIMNAMAAQQSRQASDDRPQYSRNTLFRNRGDGTFAELARFAGVDASDWTWCPVFLDVDLDGFEDLLAITGHWRDAQDADAARELDALTERSRLGPREMLRLRRRFPRLETPNFAFRNRGDLTFEETGAAWGFDSTRISQGIALADLDNDGDLDVVVNCLNAGPLLYRNDSSRARVAVRLRGIAPNTRGIGARITVKAPGLPVQSQEMIAGGRYLGSDDPVRTFAAGAAQHPLELEVRWRSGRRTVLTNAPADTLYELDEAFAVDGPVSTPVTNAPWFEDRSRILGHQHVDLPFDDFARQPLLPHSLSQPGPAVAWFDFNNDGWEDLLVGAGRGGRVAVFRSDGAGGFIPQRAQILQTPSDRDLTGLLGWRPSPTNLVLLTGLDRYEGPPSTQGAGLRQISLVNGLVSETVLGSTSSSGALALGDVDGDGELELFVGGRVIPGRYPEPASSVLLRPRGGRFELDPRLSLALAGVGLVTAATFTDLQGDSRPELVLAREWDSLVLFRLEEGGLVPWNPAIRWTENPPPGPPPAHLSDLRGWWTSVAAGDFDGDGRLDLVAGNWGRNTARQAYLSHPLQLHYAAIEGSESLGLIEAHFDPASGRYVPDRDRTALGAVFPGLPTTFASFTAFGKASLAEILAAGLPPTREVHASVLDSVLLLNRGDALEVRPLPREAQVAPIFGIAVADFDGDGKEDCVVVQNLFDVAPGESRHDAGVGCWLRGDGAGHFEPVDPRTSGIRVWGEGRACAVADFDHDGRPDLVVGQNRGPTLLYQNRLGRPGLRVILRGGPRNPQAIGATLRAEFSGGRAGPVREIRLGGGYWSQDASAQVLATPEPPRGVVVRWPSGKVRRVSVPPDDTELEIEELTP